MDAIHYEPDVSDIKTILIYSNFFEKDTLPDLEDEISKVNMHKSISIICELIILNESNLLPIKLPFLEFSIPFQSVLKFIEMIQVI